LNNPAGSDSGIVKLIVADRPEPPRFPRVENMLDEAAILSWKPPNSDGGSLITEYIVEKREMGGQWQKCARSRFTYMTVEGLRPKETYEFQISAENKHGISEPCEPTAPIVIPESRIRRYNGNGLGVNSISHSRSYSLLNIESSYGLRTSPSSSSLSRQRLTATASSTRIRSSVTR